MDKEIRTALRKWLGEIDIPAQVLTDREDGLRVIFETEHALAELLAGEPEFAPCRSVSFVVLDTRRDLHAPPVFCFYDDESHTAADILRELNRGIRFLNKEKCLSTCVSNGKNRMRPQVRHSERSDSGVEESSA